MWYYGKTTYETDGGAMEELRQAINNMKKEDIVSLIEFVKENGSADFVQSLVELLVIRELSEKQFQ